MCFTAEQLVDDFRTVAALSEDVRALVSLISYTARYPTDLIELAHRGYGEFPAAVKTLVADATLTSSSDALRRSAPDHLIFRIETGGAVDQ